METYETVLNAVTNHCISLKYASEELRNNNDIILQAMKNNIYQKN